MQRLKAVALLVRELLSGSGSGGGELARAGSLVAAPEANAGGSEAESRELDLYQALGAMLEQRDALAGVRLALHVYMYVCMYVYIYIHILYICIYIYIYIVRFRKREHPSFLV